MRDLPHHDDDAPPSLFVRKKVPGLLRKIGVTSYYPTIFNAIGVPAVTSECIFIFISMAVIGVSTWYGWKRGAEIAQIAQEHGFSPDLLDGPTGKKYIEMIFQMPMMSTLFNASIHGVVMIRQLVYFVLDTGKPIPYQNRLNPNLLTQSLLASDEKSTDTISVRAFSRSQRVCQAVTTLFWDGVSAAQTCVTSIFLPVLFYLLGLLEPTDEEAQNFDGQYNRAVAFTAVVMTLGLVTAGRKYLTSGTDYETAIRKSVIEVAEVHEYVRSDENLGHYQY